MTAKARENSNNQIESRTQYGVLESFPNVTHAKASIEFSTEVTELQKCVASAFRGFNSKTLETQISIAGRPGPVPGYTAFEAGVGDGDCFNFLDEKELKRLLSHIESGQPVRTLDFFLIVKYLQKDGTKSPIRFDRYLIRLSFAHQELDVKVFHEKGLRRMNPDEVVTLLIDDVNLELTKSGKPGLRVISLRSA